MTSQTTRHYNSQLNIWYPVSGLCNEVCFVVTFSNSTRKQEGASSVTRNIKDAWCCEIFLGSPYFLYCRMANHFQVLTKLMKIKLDDVLLCGIFCLLICMMGIHTHRKWSFRARIKNAYAEFVFVILFY